MVKALSVDLRTRVVAAVAAGASHRTAATRFGASAASVSRWRALEREKGGVRPGPLGGDRRSGRIETQAALILGLLAETPDTTCCGRRRATRPSRCPTGTTPPTRKLPHGPPRRRPT